MDALQPRYIIAFILALLVGYLMLMKNRGRIDSAAAHKLVEDGAKLVDVRSPSEYASGHVDGAINIPLDTLASRLGELGAKDQPLVLYCASGMRSGRAVGILEGKGFTAVHNLGGMSRW